MFFPIGKELLRSLYLYFLWAMEQMLQQVELRYHLVFFNSVCCDYKNFLKFKQMFKTLPLKFYTKLESIVIVHPNFAIRALQWLSFGTLNSMLSKYVVLAQKYSCVSHIASNSSFLWECSPNRLFHVFPNKLSARKPTPSRNRLPPTKPNNYVGTSPRKMR